MKKYTLGRMMVALVLCCCMCISAVSAADTTKTYNINGTIVTFGTMEKAERNQRANNVIYEIEKYDKFTTPNIQCDPYSGNYLSVEVKNIGNNPILVRYTAVVSGERISDTRVVYSNTPTPWCGFSVKSPSNTIDCSFQISVEPYISGQAINYTITAWQYFN